MEVAVNLLHFLMQYAPSASVDMLITTTTTIEVVIIETNAILIVPKNE